VSARRVCGKRTCKDDYARVHTASSHTHQERRVSARRGSASALAKALPHLLGRRPPVCWRTPLQSRSCNHGGLTPPALVRALARRRNCDFSDAQMHIRRSGTCQPAVIVGNARAKMITPRFRQRRRTRGAGAAGVSPPWDGKRTC